MTPSEISKLKQGDVVRHTDTGADFRRQPVMNSREIALERLILARAIIEDPAHWTQGVYARDADGYPRLEDHPEAVCWCITGACRLANADAALLVHELNFSSGLIIGVPEFNDYPGTSHEKVLGLFDKAISFLL